MSATAAPPEPAPATQHLRHACPVAAAEDALLLLASGRVAMAQVVVATLPRLILLAENEQLRRRLAELKDALAERRALQGQIARLACDLADVRATLGVARKAAAKPLAKPHERLAAALADGRVTVQRVAAVLRVDDPHVFELAAGRVGLASSAWKKVFSELEVGTS
jgi:hypothetical protein